jgi:ATP synthase F1 complex assembly factor 1
VRSEAAVDPAIDAALNATSIRVAPETTPFNPPPQPAAASSPIASAARMLSESSKNVPPGVKTLSSFVDLHRLSIHEDPKDIELIWRARFVDDHKSLCAVMPTETYQRMEAVARRHPMFLLPLPREGQGVEMHLLQWTFPAKKSATIIFTTLADYKQRGEFALPHTTVTHHLELAESKKMVLVQGRVAPDRGVSVDHARLLVMTLQKFYGAIEGKVWERRRQMLEMFSRGDEKFSIDALIEEAERTV